uniref:Uncharacterized protein n=1 Tax=Arundo donax TaxID=35708 RepID=A0A0A9BUK6_ARUDO
MRHPLSTQTSGVSQEVCEVGFASEREESL